MEKCERYLEVEQKIKDVTGWEEVVVWPITMTDGTRYCVEYMNINKLPVPTATTPLEALESFLPIITDIKHKEKLMEEV